VKYEDFDREIGVFGDSRLLRGRVQALRREYGMDEFHLLFQPRRIMDHAWSDSR